MVEMIRRLAAPLLAATTYRRGVFLLLGGVIVLPYTQLGFVFATMLGDSTVPRTATVLLLVVALFIACVPAVLRGTRALEITAVRNLLGVDLPDPAESLDRETRLRTALWFALHLLVGGLVGLALLIALPLALVFVVRIGPGAEILGPFASVNSLVLMLIGLALLMLLGYTIAGLGSLAAVMAPVLLGPSTSERIAALELQAGQLAQRNRLARELHDSIGHALTVTTLQAAAAQRVLGNDPQFVRQALIAIEETGRSAIEELDHVLGLLRDPGASGRAPQRTLGDLEGLLTDARSAGLSVTAVCEGPLDKLSPAVSREAFRIVQEGLTNAARHAPGSPVRLRLAVAGETLQIELTNPASDGALPMRTGSGLTGMRERVSLLGGHFIAERDGSQWRVEARLPAGRLHE